MILCEYCEKEAYFALFELKEDGSKKWRQVCDYHDKKIARQNGSLLKYEESSKFKEVK